MKTIFITITMMLSLSAYADRTQEEEIIATLTYLAGELAACSEHEEVMHVQNIVAEYAKGTGIDNTRYEAIYNDYGKKGIQNMVSGNSNCSEAVSIYSRVLANND